jgi:LysR family glycine cleavage system transcriptional activator
MARKLPPLHLLHLFEAAGRNLSFKKAGEELHLTPSAISHQIKALEENLAIQLFRRLTRGVELTAAGHSYLAVVQEIFQKLDKGTAILKQRYASTCLRITSFPSIASNIIIPRLSQFQSEFPDIELRIETGMNVVDLRYDEYDLALRLGDGDWPGVVSEKLFDIEVTPVCSPEFARKHQLTDIKQIADVPLIHFSVIEDSWQTWAKAVGLNDISSITSLSLGSYDAVIHAAQQGLGLALGALPLERAAITKGNLYRPFLEKIDFPQACYAVYREHDQNRDDICAFLNWMKQLDEVTNASKSLGYSQST